MFTWILRSLKSSSLVISSVLFGMKDHSLLQTRQTKKKGEKKGKKEKKETPKLVGVKGVACELLLQQILLPSSDVLKSKQNKSTWFLSFYKKTMQIQINAKTRRRDHIQKKERIEREGESQKEKKESKRWEERE